MTLSASTAALLAALNLALLGDGNSDPLAVAFDLGGSSVPLTDTCTTLNQIVTEDGLVLEQTGALWTATGETYAALPGYRAMIAAITEAKSLGALFQALQEAGALARRLQNHDSPCADAVAQDVTRAMQGLKALRGFGGRAPRSTLGVISWDRQHILIADGWDFQLVGR